MIIPLHAYRRRVMRPFRAPWLLLCHMDVIEAWHRGMIPLQWLAKTLIGFWVCRGGCSSGCRSAICWWCCV